MDKIEVSYINLGTYKDKDTGEIKPKLPKLDSHLNVVDFETVWKNQIRLDKDAPKGTNGMIFPFAMDIFHNIDYIREEGLCTNGLVFIDIDCGNAVNETIMSKIPEINERLFHGILTACLTRKGLHVIFRSTPLTANEYRLTVFQDLTAFAWQVKEICGIDLRNIKGALDSCTFSIKQRFFMRYSPKIYWDSTAIPINLDIKSLNVLKKEYNDLWVKVDTSGSKMNLPKDVRVCNYAKLYAINEVEQHEYIEHVIRWRLFDSLCCIFVQDELDTTQLFKQWNRCCELIDPVNHPVQWFKDEPIKNKWFELWCKKQYQWYDEELLEEFGYIVGNQHKRGWDNDGVASNVDDWFDNELNVLDNLYNEK